MAYSDEFIRQIGKRSAENEIKVDTLSNLFFDFMSEVPGDLRWDIFSMFFPDLEAEAMVQTSQAEKLAIVIDLFEGEYEEDNLALTNEEIQYISEGVNDFALNLSDDILMNVMKAAVARGLLG